VTIGVIDVGSNTVRLLLTRGERPLLSQKAVLRLGEDVERHGRITQTKLEKAVDAVAAFAEAALRENVEHLEVLVTSPGRQAANASELTDALAGAVPFPVRVLGSPEEGRLAFLGALDCTAVRPRRPVAVVDVGGGSTQVVVGTGADGPQWLRSIDLGSQRLTSRLLDDDPPGPAAVEAARDEVETHLEELAPPPVRTTLAVGGSARALKRICGGRIGRDELEETLRLLAETPAENVAARYGVGSDRARTLTAGCIILAAMQQRLGTPVKVVRAGLREGALVELAAARAAA